MYIKVQLTAYINEYLSESRKGIFYWEYKEDKDCYIHALLKFFFPGLLRDSFGQQILSEESKGQDASTDSYRQFDETN